MSKIIIDNRADLTDLDALDLVHRVIQDGRISNGGKQYCYVMQFNHYKPNRSFSVYSTLNKQSDRFVISENM